MKIAAVGDVHYGEHRQDEAHMELIDEFFDREFIQKRPDVDVIIICGDYFHSRDSKKTITLNHAFLNICKLAEVYHVYLIVGNHDMFEKYTLKNHSLEVFKMIPNVSVIDRPVFMSNDDTILLTPWICNEDDWNNLIDVTNKYTPKYVFGHFEFNGFKMNDHHTIKSPYSYTALNTTYIYTGHYHHRQIKNSKDGKRCCYIGSPFGFNFNDANDTERGYIIIDTENDTHQEVNYDQVQILSMEANDFLDRYQELNLTQKDKVRVVLENGYDPIIENKVIDVFKEYPVFDYKITYKTTTKSLLEQQQQSQDETEEVIDSEDESDMVDTSEEDVDAIQQADKALQELDIDKFVIEKLSQVDLSNIDNELLVDIYQNAKGEQE